MTLAAVEARRPEDVCEAFEDYRTAVERYELDFLKQQSSATMQFVRRSAGILWRLSEASRTGLP